MQKKYPEHNDVAKQLFRIIFEGQESWSEKVKNDDFFDIGGDSLKAIEFVSKAHSEGIYFNLQSVFDNPTLKSLCEHIENGDKEQISFKDMDFTQINKVLEKNTLEDVSISEIDVIKTIPYNIILTCF